MQVDLVTETDKACEDLIFNHLKQLYPTHKVNAYSFFVYFTCIKKVTISAQMPCLSSQIMAFSFSI